MDTISYVRNKCQTILLPDNSRFPFGVRVNPLTPKTRVACLVPRPHYSAWLIRFGLRDPSEPSSETSPKCINREGLGKRRTGTIGNAVAR